MKKYLKYIITTIIGLVVTLLILFSKKIFQQDKLSEIYKILTDAFFVPGVLIFGFGLLVYSSNQGTFDIVSYGMKAFFNLFRTKPQKQVTYYEYKLAKHEHDKPIVFFLIVGGGFLIVSMIFMILELNA